jgi:hypothetical protein
VSALLDSPRWTAAAQALVDGCLDLPDDESRVALLAAVCDRLGDDLYPAFLRVLWLVGEFGDHAACAAVAGALVHALGTGRLPSGRRAAWGAVGGPDAGAAYGTTRSLGPIEYLCAWHAQAAPEHALAAEHFHVAARALMGLVGASTDARRLYCEKLLADVADPLSGALTRRTRSALRALASAWAAGGAPDDVSACFLTELSRADASPGGLTIARRSLSATGSGRWR